MGVIVSGYIMSRVIIELRYTSGEGYMFRRGLPGQHCGASYVMEDGERETTRDG